MDKPLLSLTGYVQITKIIKNCKDYKKKRILCNQIYDTLIENSEKMDIAVLNDFYIRYEKFLNNESDEKKEEIAKKKEELKKNQDEIKDLMIYTDFCEDLEDILNQSIITPKETELIIKKSSSTMSLLERLGIDPFNIPETLIYLNNLFDIEYHF
ncbi:MAG: hypothetical protein PHT94_01265 [Candidatus Nanoarchaeia archaeon]|nr:hypothetical protein [Candidatus Nanoarchaeia archaeon]